MEKIAMFHKVSENQFMESWRDCFGETTPEKWIHSAYREIIIPRRATKGSAGYDFFAPMNIKLYPGESITLPTGIRVEMNRSWALFCFPRSGLGFRYRLQLDNTVGIIDSDYFYSFNEGHIHAKITNDSREGRELIIPAGTGFMQGIFLKYGITRDDHVTEKRNGGFGSTTGRKK